VDINKAYCGIDCSACPVYIATINDDDDLRRKTAKEWGVLYNRKFNEEDILCYGCKSQRLFFLCAKCDIRECNVNKGIDTCSQCNKYPCDRIEKLYNWIEKNGF